MNPLITDFQAPQQRTPIIVTLDFADRKSTLGFVHNLGPALCQIRIDEELFTATGRSLMGSLVHQGFKLFLDLRYHGTPYTVARACKVAADIGMWVIDMHVSDGHRMMEATAETVTGYNTKLLLIGVAVLTSMGQSDLTEIGLNTTPEEQVIRLAKLMQSSGLDNVVCSTQKAAPLRRELGQGFVLVTPDICSDVAGNNDGQRRTMTPAEALAAGSTYLVVDRSVTQAADPVAVLHGVSRVANLETS